MGTLKDKLMTSPGPYLAMTQKYLSFTSLCLALKKFSGLTKNGGGGGGKPDIGLKAFEKFLPHFQKSLDIFGYDCALYEKSPTFELKKI